MHVIKQKTSECCLGAGKMGSYLSSECHLQEGLCRITLTTNDAMKLGADIDCVYWLVHLDFPSMNLFHFSPSE